MNSHLYHSAHQSLRTLKTPVVLRSKRRKLALSVSTKRLSSVLLMFFLLLAGRAVITAQTSHPSPFAIAAASESALSRRRDKEVQPNLSIAKSPEHAAAGGSSFFKRAIRSIWRFGKTLISAFGEGKNSSVRSKSDQPSRDDKSPVNEGRVVGYEPLAAERPTNNNLAIAENSKREDLVAFVWRSHSRKLGEIQVPPQYREETEAYREGIRTTLTYPDGSYIVLHLGGMIKLPFFDKPEHEVFESLKLPERIVRAGRLRDSDLFWREENSYGLWPARNLGFTKVPRSRVIIFEKALASFRSEQAGLGETAAANMDFDRAMSRSEQTVVATSPQSLKAKPSVYIEFERTGYREPLYARESEQGIWLRLHNKSNQPIVLDMNGVPSEYYGDASLIYDVLSEGQVVEPHSCHVCSFNSLGPGRSLLFSLPAEHLSEGRSIRVKFAPDSEDSGKPIQNLQPEYVYFHASQLPK